jgi:hypothetical protein
LPTKKSLLQARKQRWSRAVNLARGLCPVASAETATVDRNMSRSEHLVRGIPSFRLTQEEVIFCITLVLIAAFSILLLKFLTAGNILTLLNNVPMQVSIWRFSSMSSPKAAAPALRYSG